MPLPRPLRVALLGLTAAGLACGSGQDQPIILGLAGPLSDPRGAAMQRGAELAVREINAAGGIRGRRLTLTVADDSADAQRAVRVAQVLRQTPDVVAVVGHLTSAATLAAAPIYDAATNPVVQISPSASSPQLSDAGDYTFRICPDDLVHGRRLAEWAWQRLGARSAAILYHNDPYGRGMRTSFAASFTGLGGHIVAEDPYVPDLPTVEPYLSRVRQRGGAGAVMIAGTRAAADWILPELRAAGIQAWVLGGDALAGLEASVTAEAEGTFISSAYLPDRPGERNARFVTAYREAYDDRLPDHRAAGAYDIVHLIARALTAVGPDRERLRVYLAGVGSRTPAFEGVTGTIAFDERGDVPTKDVLIGVVRSGRLVTAPGQ